MERKLDTSVNVKDTCHVKNTVRELRTSNDMSQSDLGGALGVSRQTINSIENGRYLPSLPLALAMARCFDTTVEAIFTPDEEDGR
jgi:putative transcriptional regulator